MGAGPPAGAQPMPQDYWCFSHSFGSQGTGDGQFSSPGPIGIAYGPENRLYVCDRSASRIQVFECDGTFVGKWGASGSGDGQFSTPLAITAHDGLLYVVDAGNQRVQVVEPDGTFVRKWGSGGSGEGQFAFLPASAQYPSGIAVGPNNRVYVSDSYNHRVQVFETNGTFVLKWGSNGSGLGQFLYPSGLGVDPDGTVYVTEADGNNSRIQAFREDGTFLRQWSNSIANAAGLAISPDGRICVAGYQSDRLYVFEPDGTPLRSWGDSSNLNDPNGVTFGADGTAYVTVCADHEVQVFRRAYRVVDTPAMPLPYVLGVEQRAGTGIVDIDYRITDRDSSNVYAAALAFVDGSNDLSRIVRLSSFVDGTETNIGPAVPTGTDLRISWDAATDWDVELGNVEVEILANDDGGLLDAHFITIPSNGPDPELTINCTPILEPDMLSCWYWLLATNDAGITLNSSGQVFGVGGAYDGQLLAQATSTTTNGRTFLFERMNVREATSNEVQRAKEGATAGTVNQFDPDRHADVGPGDRPRKVNEYGFDTGNWGTSGTCWIVKEP